MARDGRAGRPPAAALAATPQINDVSHMDAAVQKFADELRKWWAFNDRQWHTHSWHDREDFIAKMLPELLSAYVSSSSINNQQKSGDGTKRENGT